MKRRDGRCVPCFVNTVDKCDTIENFYPLGIVMIKSSRISVFLAVAMVAASVGAEALPPLPDRSGGGGMVDRFDYSSAASLQKAWRSVSGTAPATISFSGGRKVLRLPCNFRGTEISRACWDYDTALDMTASTAIQFKLFSPDTSPVSHFTFYLRSGSGWYAAPFDHGPGSAWSTVTIEKDGMESEGAPAGWSRIDRIRIAAWRGESRDTTLYLADLETLGGNADIVIIRGDAAVGHDKKMAKPIAQFARTVAQQLKHLGISHAFLSDQDVSRERLKGKKLAILPYNPTVTDDVLSALEHFINNGGKLLCFYMLPERLGPLVGIRRGTHIKPSYPGQFASIRPTKDNVLGLPVLTGQSSWNIYKAQPVEGKSSVVGEWYDVNGEATGEPALIASKNCIVMTHVFIDDDPLNKQDLLLAMTGNFIPECRLQAAKNSIAEASTFGPYNSSEDASARIGKLPGCRSLTRDLLNSARSLLDQARKHLSAERFAEARTAAGKARLKLIEAHCSAQSSAGSETRAFWCHSAFGIDGLSWDAAIKLLADNGFNAIIPNMLWGGVAYYPSEVLPTAPEVETQGDQVAACAAACRKYGVECHVWKVNWNMGWKTDPRFLKKMADHGRVQVHFSGTVSERWLCPSHPQNQKLEIDAMLEVARKYNVAGIHFDYIRYPGNDYCFCKGCRSRFEKALGRKIAEWPSEVRNDGALTTKWQDFRRSNITRVVSSVSSLAKQRNPDIKISAAVFPNWQTDRDNVAQDWKLWCEKGYLDFVCPMDYTPSNAQFENRVKRQKEWAGKVPVYPGIGLSSWSRAGNVCKLIDQILITRRHRMGGFTVFEYGASEAKTVVPLCGIGITGR